MTAVGRWCTAICLLFLLPRVSIADETREEMVRARCLANLKKIMFACMRYAQDYGERFPDTLAHLYLHYVSGADTFRCPGDTATPPFATLTPDTRTSYLLVPGLTERDSPTFPLVYDASPDHHGGKGRCVAFVGGQGRFVSEEELQKLLASLREEKRKEAAAPGVALLSAVLTAQKVYYAKHDTFATSPADLPVFPFAGSPFPSYRIVSADSSGFVAETSGTGDLKGITVRLTYSASSGSRITYSGL